MIDFSFILSVHIQVVHDVVSQLQDYDLLGGKKLSAKESSQIATEVSVSLFFSFYGVIDFYRIKKKWD